MGFQTYDVFVKQGAYLSPKMSTNTGAGGSESTRTIEGRVSSEIVVTLAIEFLMGWLDEPDDDQPGDGGAVGDAGGEAGAAGAAADGAAGGAADETGGAADETGGDESSGIGDSSPWLLHVCFKETHERWNYPPEYKGSLPSLMAHDYPPGRYSV